MILLFAGASETREITKKLTRADCPVTVSTATDTHIEIEKSPLIQRRCGQLTAEQTVSLIAETGAVCLVHACHPYASQVRSMTKHAADQAGIPRFLYIRQGSSEKSQDILRVKDHRQAAEIAFSFNQPVLLTTGSGNLTPYAEQSGKTGIPCFVRVLDHPDSITACKKAGIPSHRVIAGRGPFTVRENLEHLGTSGAGVLVTKDGGERGGVPEKIRAAREGRILIVLVEPDPVEEQDYFTDIDELCTRVINVYREMGHE